jgi:hypothetical protein
VNLQRLGLTFIQEGVEIRNLYRTQDGRNTKARTKEVSKLTRTGKP